MAHTTSQLQTKLSTEAQNNEGQPWSTVEAAVELLLTGQAAGPTGGATSAKQDTQITAEQAILAALNARLGKGAANLSSTQVTSTGIAATLAIARATRRSVLFTNTHATGSVWIGPATVTSSNGQKLGPGQACPFTWVGLYQVIDDGATHCVVCVADEYD